MTDHLTITSFVFRNLLQLFASVKVRVALNKNRRATEVVLARGEMLYVANNVSVEPRTNLAKTGCVWKNILALSLT